MRRVKHPVALTEAKQRLIAYRDDHESGQLFPASRLAYVIWPDAEFLNAQGAGAAASRVLKKIGATWMHQRQRGIWGWSLARL